MAVRAKRQLDPKEAAKAKQVEDRVRRARMANPPRNAWHYEQCAELAREVGADPCDVMDLYDEIASTQEYLANVSRQEAERLAMEQVRDRYERQRRIA